jgi:hypothetical protein
LVFVLLAFPTRYAVTAEGIWVRVGVLHTFVSFEEVEGAEWSDGRQVVLAVKGEGRGNRRLRPTDPAEFIRCLPERLREEVVS